MPTRYRGLPARVRVRVRESLALAVSLPIVSSATRARVLQCLGHRTVGARINPLVRLLGGGRLIIGSGSFVNSDCCFDLSNDIRLGERVHVGPRVSIYTSTHRVGTTDCMAGDLVTAPVSIASGVWVGAGATILPGVTIGRGIIVGAGAVVTRDLQEPGTYVGVPAERVSRLG